MPRLLDDEERIDWLQLSRTDGIGPITFHRLLMRFGSAASALAALPDLAARGGRAVAPRSPARTAIAEDIEAAARFGGRYIAYGERDYPAYLAQIADAPPLICVAGRRDLLELDAVAVVGARNASASGRKLARMLAEQLGKAGFLVVSGLARGIDTAAHEAALGSQTAAVVAGGLDYVYPPENENLQVRIAKDHVLISEMAMRTVPKAEHFPRRNRIISGLCRAVIVVEAALRSGSLITARLALEQGREVFAVPGSPLDPRCEGGNRLIRDGASLLLSADDVLEALLLPRPATPSFLLETEQQPALQDDASPPDRQHVLSLLSHVPIHADDLAREAGLAPEVLAACLLELEVAGRIDRSASGEVRLAAA